MNSALKSETARRNGAKSRGPISASGKRVSSQNAVKHGLTSRNMFLLRNETPLKWEELLDNCMRQFQPQNGFEHDLVVEIALARWRMRRVWTVEAALIDTEMDKQDPELRCHYAAFDEGVRLASAYKELADTSRSLAAVTRHESRIRRNFERALADLERLRAMQPDFQNEPKESGALLPVK